VAGLLDAVLFHWTPDRAIWIGGHTLSWDARCAGIYAGFAFGAAWQLAADWRAWRIPSAGSLLVVALFALPLFVDVLSLMLALRVPSNDLRFLTGLLFGGTLSIALLPAALSLAAPANRRSRLGALRFAPILVGVLALFLLKAWDHPIAFAAMEGLCYAGLFMLAALLGTGMTLAFRRALR
jgi:uncharacterized membrane protein